MFKIIGALGILIIAAGILINNRKKQSVFYIIGGVCLEIYSIYISDVIFIILQLIFIFTAIYALIKNQVKK